MSSVPVGFVAQNFCFDVVLYFLEAALGFFMQVSDANEFVLGPIRQPRKIPSRSRLSQVCAIVSAESHRAVSKGLFARW